MKTSAGVAYALRLGMSAKFKPIPGNKSMIRGEVELNHKGTLFRVSRPIILADVETAGEVFVSMASKINEERKSYDSIRS